MLPLRIELEGFLTYRRKTTLDFRSDWLWAITGPNGAGKSAIFDAITFALFGEHRGGNQHEERLISQRADYARVAFDFVVDGSAYRAERTLERRRRRGGRSDNLAKSYAIYALNQADRELTTGPVIPGTDTVKGFEQWVQDTVGLTAKTFASSVLLRQGEADKFVLAKPAERKGVLLEVLDLGPYIRLEKATRNHANEWDAKAQAAERQFKSLEHATPEALAQAKNKRGAAQQEAEAAAEALRTAGQTLDNARDYAGITKKISDSHKRLVELQAVIEHASIIEAAEREKIDLDNALPKLRSVLRFRNSADESRQRAADSQRLAAAMDVSGAEKVCLQQAEAAKKAELDYETARQALGEAQTEEERLRPLAKAADTLARLEDEFTRAEHDAATLETETASLAEATQARLHECDAAAQARAGLQALALDRAEAATAEAERDKEATQILELETKASQAEMTAVAGRTALANAAEAVKQAELIRAGKNQELASAQKELLNRRAAKDEGRCSRCGQPVDAEHIRQEIADCEARIFSLRGELRGLDDRVERERESERKLADDQARLEGEREAANDALATSQRTIRECVQRRDQALRRAAQHMVALPEPYHTIAATPNYPDKATLAHVSSLAAAQPAANKMVETLKSKVTRAAILREHASRARSEVAKIAADFPGVDLAAAKTARETAQERVKELAAVEKQALSAWQKIRSAEKAAEQALKEARDRRQDLLKNADDEAAAARADEQALTVVKEQLAVDWQERVATLDTRILAGFEARLRQIEPIAAQKSALNAARTQIPAVESELKIHGETLEGIPEEDRIPVEVAEEHLASAQGAHRDASKARDDAIAAETLLADECERRAEAEKQVRLASGLAHDYRRLMMLLGKNYLQAWLLQTAQANISQAANQFLGAISDGLLRLELKPKGDDLEIRISDLGSGEEPMDVKFVSGSQRFRVAVSLALAIGQYSGGASRAIKSVIIDEGFGSLDVDGRHQMIEQLKALEGTLDRVILVSHHEAFHEAFPNGYHIEKVDSISRAILRREVVDAEAQGI